MIKNIIVLLYDTIRYRSNRRVMRRMHSVFSGYMLVHISYLIRNIEQSSNIPNSVDTNGEVNGTMSRAEWLEILLQIEYSLKYDISNNVNKDKLPENIAEIGEYLNKQEQEEKRYKQGLILLGRYYSDIWG